MTASVLSPLLLLLLRKGLQMSSKPPLSCGISRLVTAELWVHDTVITKVVFAWHCTRSWVKLAAGMTAVNVPKDRGSLPDTCCQMHSHVPADVNIFHLHALAWPGKIDYVKVFEVATDVIFEIDTIGWVAASCSPVSGMSLQWPHSSQAQAVQIPILGVLIHWSVAVKGNRAKRCKRTMFISWRHHQCPRCTRLRLHITVSRVTVTSVVVQFVHATIGGASR